MNKTHILADKSLAVARYGCVFENHAVRTGWHNLYKLFSYRSLDHIWKNGYLQSHIDSEDRRYVSYEMLEKGIFYMEERRK